MKKLPYEIPEFLLALTAEEIKANSIITPSGDLEETDIEGLPVS